MNIVADENLALLDELFGEIGNIRKLPGRRITSGDLEEADILLVRSVTRVDRSLLEGSPVRFVGSATIGSDHLDTEWLLSQGIRVATAPGCNARAVVEYVLAVLARFYALGRFHPGVATVGVVGLGNVGGRLARQLSALGVRVLGCDPFRLLEGIECAGLDRILSECDVVCLHTPLTRSGSHPTWHMLDRAALHRLKPGAILINAGRGSVIDNHALAAMLADETLPLGGLALDVWENEPDILESLLLRTDIATPHVAGYSLEGKCEGSRMVAAALRHSLGCPPPVELSAMIPHAEMPLPLPLDATDEWSMLAAWMPVIYPVMRDDAGMRALAGQGAGGLGHGFDLMRRQYPLRREISAFRAPPEAPLSSRLRETGFHA